MTSFIYTLLYAHLMVYVARSAKLREYTNIDHVFKSILLADGELRLYTVIYTKFLKWTLILWDYWNVQAFT